jgi:hypothetical protein
MANIHGLCLDSVTSQGKDPSVEATVAPSPASTSSDGRAQQSKVPTELNSEKQLRKTEVLLFCMVAFHFSTVIER